MCNNVDWFTLKPWNFKANQAYEPAKNLRDKIHCFDIMLMFANYAHGASKLSYSGEWSESRDVCGDSFHALRSPGVSGVEMKIYERSLQALLSSAHSLARSREAHFAYPWACSHAK